MDGSICISTTILTLCVGCSGTRATEPQSTSPVQAVEPADAISPATSAKLRAALAGPARSEKERGRDAARHPFETLAFFGLRDDAHVVELWPGGGYYTAILAPVLAERGALRVTRFDPGGDPKSEDTQEARLILDRLAKTPDVFARVETQPIATPAVSLGPDASADLVLTFRNVHNWIEAGYAENVFAAAFRVLVPGGVLGVEEHRGRPGMTVKEIRDTGYVPEDVVIGLAQHAGFRLTERSEVNANPRDSKDYPDGVWSLPPTLAGHDKDRDRYIAIGESDRMTLRFLRP